MRINSELSPPGELIDVNDHFIHIQRQGENSPTVVFEAGIYANSLNWGKVQPEVSKSCRTISYDRAGMGYSDPSPDSDRSSSIIASELFALLDILDEKEPMIFVGWSAGGIYIRQFAYEHPELVAGIMFIDSAHENAANRKPEELAKLERQSGPNPQREYLKELSKMTYKEIMTKMADAPLWKMKHPDTYRYFEDQARPEQFDYFLKLWEMLQIDWAQGDEALKPLGKIPLINISQASYGHESLTNDLNKLLEDHFHGLQDELTSLSTNSRSIKAEAGHDIANEKPEIVIDAIIELVEQVRSSG
jgi:pimeloyl-ACP methyl ester carboxylesterase